MKDYGAVNKVYSAFFCEGEFNHRPARVCVAVLGLPKDGESPTRPQLTMNSPVPVLKGSVLWKPGRLLEMWQPRSTL